MTANRRSFLSASAAGIAWALLPLGARALPNGLQAAMAERYGGATPQPGRVTLELPGLAENGHSVSLGIQVDSPMTTADHVTLIDLWSEANPLPHIVRFELSPLSGAAEMKTRIRLADSQTLTAVATLSDGSLWQGSAKTIVTLAACTDFLI